MSATKSHRDADANRAPSRMQIIAQLEARATPPTSAELHAAFALPGAAARRALDERVSRMQGQGALTRDARGRIKLAAGVRLIQGRITALANGRGLITPDAGEALPLHYAQMRRVLHGDRVHAILHADGRRVEILQLAGAAAQSLVGNYYFESGVAFVTPEDRRIARDIMIPNPPRKKVNHADVVLVRLTEHPFEDGRLAGEIVKVLGAKDAHGMAVTIAIHKYDLPHAWPPEVDAELAQLDLNEARFDAGRRDLRDLPLVTIDGEDARDFDDAVFAEASPRGWRLLVAIADVAHYVSAGGALDAAAFARGNSVYFPEQAIPMLPEALSNGACSLQPLKARYCMACDMQFDRAGKLRAFEFYPGVMRSQARLTYAQAADIIAGKNPRKACARVAPQIRQLEKLSAVLHRRRASAGAIEFTLPEPWIRFDAARRIRDITVRPRNRAHALIEECMLAANVCAAQLLTRRFGDAIYRNHAGPDSRAALELRKFLGLAGVTLPGGDQPHAKHYAAALAAAARGEHFAAVQIALLRAFGQAEYARAAGGHFALAFPLYTHFTSPIRRYADLVVHRLIRAALCADDTDAAAALPLDDIAAQCNAAERRADAAVRDATARLKAEFMRDKLGETFDATVSGVREFGVFVTLNRFFVDGLIHVSELGDDYFHYDAATFSLRGERGGECYRIGMKLRVTLSRVDADAVQLDFVLADKKHGKRN